MASISIGSVSPDSAVKRVQVLLDVLMQNRAVSGYAAQEPPPPTPTLFSFACAGRSVYVDYGMRSEADTIRELRTRIADGKPFVDFRQTVTRPDATSYWDPAHYLRSAFSPGVHCYPTFRVDARDLRNLTLSPALEKPPVAGFKF